ncbi:MAG: flagellar basal body P-ring formation protein FlgA [Alphaproteobacteria bacterium]|nr:flagellar basal body P-ring formation protein FlgA [Alphaproteobacteria bacterium]
MATVKRSKTITVVSLALQFALGALTVLLVAAAILALGTAKAHAGPMPKAEVLVKGENIRLGDVFEGLAQHADFVLAPAPKPGERLVWNEPTLTRIATAFNLPWRPTQGQEIAIRREASMVDAETLRAVIRDHLATLNDTDSFNVSISSDVPEIIVPSFDMPQISVSDFSMPESGGPFSAIIKVSAANGKSQTVTMRGLAERMVHVPVLKHPVRNGSIIDAADIEWATQPANSIRRDVIRTAEDLIGTTPRKTLNAGTFITPNDLTQPYLITRGDMVMMVYKQGGMYLTAKGRAMEDGVSGQVIKVSNIGSNRQIEARVTGKKEVSVTE